MLLILILMVISYHKGHKKAGQTPPPCLKIRAKMNDCIMVILLDCNSEISSHVRSHLCYLICLRHLIRSRAVTNRIFFLQIYIIRSQYVLSHHLIKHHNLSSEKISHIYGQYLCSCQLPSPNPILHNQKIVESDSETGKNLSGSFVCIFWIRFIS